MLITLLLWTLVIVVALLIIPWLIGVRYIPHNKVGIVEKFWSQRRGGWDDRFVGYRNHKRERVVIRTAGPGQIHLTWDKGQLTFDS